ncbi:hypothetical protein [Nodularia sphaerocarpa]|uniref:hypothetical protein n=1 Tax=Nodularia sphaerocarpa TaxID=137816 RepID=UPI00232D44D3|nr:hypothetical protein [Nodularia sphaerocarpa]MDB9372366.1 hypothetical protein [Nodularia sphaerocarpa CS-585]MDB9377982.1 hypothetical protein [Nodularia sphaerocarpa CS-585A2]
MLKTLILVENEVLKKVEILSLSQELVVSVHFGSIATRTGSNKFSKPEIYSDIGSYHVQIIAYEWGNGAIP